MINKNLNFKSWLAGLIEGDGSIVVPEARRKGERKNYPHIQIAFNIKDRPLAEKIVGIVGGGRINIDGNTVRLIWNRKADLLKVIEWINGYMRTPKILRLHQLIDWFNEESSENFEKKGIDSTPIGENAWLSGMSDADSNFSIILTTRGQSYRVQRQWRLEISQKTHYGGYQQGWAILVSAYLETNLLSRHRSVNITKDDSALEQIYSSYMMVAHNQNSLNKIEGYFERFPLFSSKYLDYKDWKNCGLIVEKTSENHEKVKKIKGGMNSQRAYFNWEHLENLKL